MHCWKSTFWLLNNSGYLNLLSSSHDNDLLADILIFQHLFYYHVSKLLNFINCLEMSQTFWKQTAVGFFYSWQMNIVFLSDYWNFALHQPQSLTRVCCLHQTSPATVVIGSIQDLWWKLLFTVVVVGLWFFCYYCKILNCLSLCNFL